MSDDELLINALGNAASPVRRPASAARRALAWSPICLLAGWIATATLHASSNAFGISGLFDAVSVATCLAAGVLLLIAALELSIPGRRSRALPLSALCTLAWSLACAVDLAAAGWPLGRLGDGVYCFTFVVSASAPMAVLVALALRRTYSVRPLRTMLLGAVGSYFLALALLTFCHHERLQLYDFSMHLAAAALVIGISTAVGWRFVSIPSGAITVGRSLRA